MPKTKGEAPSLALLLAGSGAPEKQGEGRSASMRNLMAAFRKSDVEAALTAFDSLTGEVEEDDEEEPEGEEMF